jgi:hypothetical protein
MSIKLSKLLLLMVMCSLLTACEAPNVYGSVGISSFGGYGGGARMNSSISIGGRIF